MFATEFQKEVYNMIMNPNFNRKILLGSQSPRRAYLMKESGFEIEIKTIDVDETYPETMEKSKVAEYISLKKAEAYKAILANEMIGIVADTVVFFEGEILGKPVDKKDAQEMLSKMSGNMHTVYTGVTIFDNTKQISFTGISDVYFLSLSEKEIDYYLENYKPYDKAGSYGIQEWIGFTKISRIEGSYSNIMGLPMELVYQKLHDFTNQN